MFSAARYIERLTALGVIDRAMVSAKPYSRKLAAGNVALQAGRIAQWWGTGLRGSLLLTGHAFALDMVKLGAQEPFRLPGRLRGLGEWQVALTVRAYGQLLRRTRANPGSFVGVP